MRRVNYRDKKCSKCGKVFTPTASTQAWCPQCLEKTCEVCGKKFSVRNKSKYDHARYCSNECRKIGWALEHKGENAPGYKNGSRYEKVAVTCSVCGKVILREKGQAEKWNTHFCSNKCRGIWQSEQRTGENSPKYSRVQKTCEWCGKEFLTWPSIENDVRFCSHKCRDDWQSSMMMGDRHHNWHGGVTNWKSSMMAKREYKAWRQQVLERDGYQCTVCGAKEGLLHAHHIVGVLDAPDRILDVDNGQTLCAACHAEIHKKKDIQSDL